MLIIVFENVILFSSNQKPTDLPFVSFVRGLPTLKQSVQNTRWFHRRKNCLIYFVKCIRSASAHVIVWKKIPLLSNLNCLIFFKKVLKYVVMPKLFFPNVFVNEVFAKLIFFRKYSKLSIQTVEIWKKYSLGFIRFFLKVFKNSVFARLFFKYS